MKEDCTKHISNGGIIHIFFVVVSQVCSCIFVCICKSRVRGWQRVRKGERRPVNWSCKSFLSTLLLTISLSRSLVQLLHRKIKSYSVLPYSISHYLTLLQLLPSKIQTLENLALRLECSFILFMLPVTEKNPLSSF